VGTPKRDRQRANRQQRLEELAKEAKKDKGKKWALRIGIAVPVAILALFLVAKLSGDDDATTATTVASVPEVTTTTIDAAASTTIAADTSTTVAETTTTAAIEPFAYGKGGCPAMDGTSIKQATFTQAFKQCIDPAKCRRVLYRFEQVRLIGSRHIFDVITKVAPGGGEHRVQIFSSQILSEQITESEKTSPHVLLDRSFELGCLCLLRRTNQLGTKLDLPGLEVFDEQRLALDPSHETRNENIRRGPKDPGRDHEIERDHERRR